MNRIINIQLLTAEMPDTINGVCSDQGAGKYLVFINQGLSEHDQERAFLHEMKHIYRDDFSTMKKVDEIEDEVRMIRYHVGEK